VIRRGRTVGTATPDTPEDELASLMVGRAVSLEVEKAPGEPGRPVLQVSGLIVDDDRGVRAVDGVNLVVRAGEVLGIAGVQGNGQTELVEAIMGLRAPRAGTIQVDNEDLIGMGTKQILRAGVGYIPEDRSLDGVVREFTVAENLVLDTYDRAPYGNAFRLNPAAIAASARERVSQFDIRTSSPDAPVSTLSGGNQQKVVVAREMSRPLRLFIAAQPTRGVDVGSIEFIHGRIVHERDAGTAVLVVSSELDEVVGLADRVAVMYRGRILATVSPDTPREEIGLLMAGITDSAPDGAAAAASDVSDEGET
jgi:general nucleoside transport system ATP-binding protein